MSQADERVAAILRGPAGPRTAAFFDFDGTLNDGFSATAFLTGAGIPLHRLLGAALGGGPRRSLRLLAAQCSGEPSDGDVRFARELALRASRAMSEDELDAVAERVFAERIAPRLRPELWSLVRAHQQMGHRVAVITSATRRQVEPLAASLGIEHVLCGDPSPSEPLLRGAAKAVAAVDFACEYDIELEASHAYADAGDDVAFLGVCGHPCAVEPSRALARAARERGWPVLRPSRRPGLGPVTAGRSAAAWTLVLAGLGAGLGLAAAGLDRRAAGEFGMAFASRACLELAGVRVNIQADPAHLAARPAVFLFNHQSWLDVAVVARLLHHDYTAFAKGELGRVPGLADFARLLDVVFVDRSVGGLGPDGFQPVLDLLARGMSVAVAPEGTRSSTPAPGPFKKGAFLLARMAGVPIVPVVIRNAGRLMPRGSKTVQAGRIDVVVHPPVHVTKWRIGELGQRIEEVRGLYLDTLTTGRARAADGSIR